MYCPHQVEWRRKKEGEQGTPPKQEIKYKVLRESVGWNKGALGLTHLYTISLIPPEERDCARITRAVYSPGVVKNSEKLIRFRSSNSEPYRGKNQGAQYCKTSALQLCYVGDTSSNKTIYLHSSNTSSTDSHDNRLRKYPASFHIFEIEYQLCPQWNKTVSSVTPVPFRQNLTLAHTLFKKAWMYTKHKEFFY